MSTPAGVALEALGRVQAIAFDKTGTLTKGAIQLTGVTAAREHELELLAAQDFGALVGHGVGARVEGREI